MSGVLVLGHSPDLRDNHLWLELMQGRPDVTLAVPRAGLLQRRVSGPHAGRILDLHVRRLGSDTATVVGDLDGLLKSLRPDVVHVDNEPWSLVVQHLVRIGQTTVSHGAENVITTAPWPYRIRRLGLRRTLAGLAGCATWGQTALDELRAIGLLDSTPTAVVPARPPSPAFFPTVPLRASDDSLVVGFVGRLTQVKGPDVVVRAVAEARRTTSVRLRVLGRGPEEKHLVQLARELQVPMDIGSAGSAAAVGAFLRDVDVVAIASRESRVWHEQWCRVAAEALLTGRPTVATDSGELRRVVGVPEWMVPENDHRAMGVNLAQLADPTALRSAHQTAVLQATRFDLGRYGDILSDLWDRVVRSSVRHPRRNQKT